MLFGQLTNRESLRDLIVALNAHSGKSYHLGLGKSVTRSNFAKANEVRNSKIFKDFAYHLIAIARELHSCDDFRIKGNIYAFDSSTIDRCLNVFWWAKFRKAKGGTKLRTLYDINTQIPAFLYITAANVHDVKARDELVYEAGVHYIFDPAYLDYTRLYKRERCSAYFVVQAKSNSKFRRMYSNKVDKHTGIRCDQIGKLSRFYIFQENPEKFRRVKYCYKESNRTFVFLTNNMKVTADDVALLYKKRWQVELFFYVKNIIMKSIYRTIFRKPLKSFISNSHFS